MKRVIIAATLIATASASAAERTFKRSLGPGTARAPVGGVLAPLTAAECVGLGGTVKLIGRCLGSNQSTCVTVDPNGVIREACINK